MIKYSRVEIIKNNRKKNRHTDKRKEKELKWIIKNLCTDWTWSTFEYSWGLISADIHLLWKM